MGRLFGMVGEVPLSPREDLQAFYALANPGYPDGWGISGFNIERAVYFGRSPQSVFSNPPLYETAIQKAEKSKTKVIVGHFRKSADGVTDISRVHPFHHRDWVLAHDGALSKPDLFQLSDTAPQGQTDSERLLHWLLERMIPEEDYTTALVAALQELRPMMEYTSLTFLLTDGQQLWAYREAKEKQTLFWKKSGDKHVLCSEPLGASSEWKDVMQKTLLVFSPSAPVPRVVPV